MSPPMPSSDDLWKRLIASRLVDAAAVTALQAEYAGLPATAAGDGSAKAIATWLISRGTLTRWQAKRLLSGDAGPFFVGPYRLLERHEFADGGLLFTARRDPCDREVTMLVIDTKRNPSPGFPDAITRRVEAAAALADPLREHTVTLANEKGRSIVVCDGVPGQALAAAFGKVGSFPDVGESLDVNHAHQPLTSDDSPSRANDPEIEAIVIRTEPPSQESGATGGRAAARAAVKAKRRRVQWIGAGLAVAAAMAIGGYVIVTQKPSSPRGNEHPPPQPAVAVDPSAAAELATVDDHATDTGAVNTPRQRLVDDPKLPWASPTDGSPPNLAYVPPGSQLVLVVRLAELMSDAEGQRLLRALGPSAAEALGRLTTLCGGDASAIELVQVAWQAGGPDGLEMAVVVRFAEGHHAPDDATRAAAWGDTVTATIDGETVHDSGVLSFWIPASEEGTVLVIAPKAMVATDGGHGAAAEEPFIAKIIRETKPLVASDAGLKTVLPGDLESLTEMLDAKRHITILGAAHFLLHSGVPLMVGPLAPLAEPLDRLLGDSIQAAALSLHLGTQAYVELDGIVDRGQGPSSVATTLVGQVASLADMAEEACARLDPTPYGRVVVLRLPAMLRVLAAQLRGGAEGRGIVVNAYLPPTGLHNIALATELALAQAAAGGAGGSAKAAAASPTAQPTTALEKLSKPMSLRFAKDNLERSIQMISEETGVPMEILGPDLQLEGITKNQSFGLDEDDKPADAILRVILAKSNPEGKLVYIVQQRDGEEWVLITTRAAVAKRGDPLPPGF